MSFDWKGYLNQAETLKEGPSEAEYRSAISRAYYCVYQLVKAAFGSGQDTSLSAHKTLIDSLIRSHPKEGKMLETLFTFRKKSDYDSRVEITEWNASFYVEQANKILKNLGL